METHTSEYEGKAQKTIIKTYFETTQNTGIAAITDSTISITGGGYGIKMSTFTELYVDNELQGIDTTVASNNVPAQNSAMTYTFKAPDTLFVVPGRTDPNAALQFSWSGDTLVWKQ